MASPTLRPLPSLMQASRSEPLVIKQARHEFERTGHLDDAAGELPSLSLSPSPDFFASEASVPETTLPALSPVRSAILSPTAVTLYHSQQMRDMLARSSEVLDSSHNPVGGSPVFRQQGGGKRFSVISRHITSTIQDSGCVRVRRTWVRSPKYGTVPDADADEAVEAAAFHPSASVASLPSTSPPKRTTASAFTVAPGADTLSSTSVQGRVDGLLNSYRHDTKKRTELEGKVAEVQQQRLALTSTLDAVQRNKDESLIPRDVRFKTMLNKLSAHSKQVETVVERGKRLKAERLRLKEYNAPHKVLARRLKARRDAEDRERRRQEWLRGLSTLHCILATHNVMHKIQEVSRGWASMARAARAIQILFRYRMRTFVRSRLKDMHTHVLIQRVAVTFRNNRYRKAARMAMDFLQKAQSTGRFKRNILAYVRAARHGQKMMKRRMQQIRCERELLCLHWDVVDAERVNRVARATRQAEVARYEEYKAKAAELEATAKQNGRGFSKRGGKAAKARAAKQAQSLKPVPPPRPLSVIAEGVDRVPFEMKYKFVTDNLRERRHEYFRRRVAYWEWVEEKKPERAKALALAEAAQLVEHDGDLNEFVFQTPRELQLPPPPRFRVLIDKLDMSVLIRLAFIEYKRVQMGWFRSQAEVHRAVNAVSGHQPSIFSSNGGKGGRRPLASRTSSVASRVDAGVVSVGNSVASSVGSRPLAAPPHMVRPHPSVSTAGTSFSPAVSFADLPA